MPGQVNLARVLFFWHSPKYTDYTLDSHSTRQVAKCIANMHSQPVRASVQLQTKTANPLGYLTPARKNGFDFVYGFIGGVSVGIGANLVAPLLGHAPATNNVYQILPYTSIS